MMQHVVALHWNDQTPPNYGDVVTPVLQEMVNHIPSIRSFRCGSDLGVSVATNADYLIVAEFDDDITVDQAKILIKDKVDVSKADTDWPTLDNGSKVEPNVFSINIAEEVPILNINLKGNYTAQQLKKYGEYLEDEIEDISDNV